MKTQLLNDNWTLAFTHPETGADHIIPAAVPGNVELDLQKANIIGEPCPVDEEHAYRWIDNTDWTYERTFTYDGLPENTVNAMLVFKGIDTIADIYLNDKCILQCKNMFIEHQVDVTDMLILGENKLKVVILAPEIYARSIVNAPFQYSPRQSSVYLRKARHMWGWDNAPHRISAGIWRNVELQFHDPIEFTDVYTYTEYYYPDTDVAEVGCRYSFQTQDRDLSQYKLRVKLFFEGEHAFETTRPVLHTSGVVVPGRIAIKNPKLWHPAGSGKPNLYDFYLILEKEGKPVAEYHQKLGIRTFRLERTEITDHDGNGEFQFYCNEEKIYIRGTNWKPITPFHSQTPERVKPALQLAVDCNCNMIRVWGGGIYEDHDFFDFCDEHGLLVWQDFMFACEFPPQDDFYLEEVRIEAEAVIKKLRNHPSLAIWCGDNEVDMSFAWGHSIQRNIVPSDNKITRQVLPLAIQNLDPARDFVPSSPYIADTFSTRRYPETVKGQGNFAPEHHIYCGNLPPGGFRQFLREQASHFCSETGPIGINAMSESPEIVALELPRMKRLWDVNPDTIPPENDNIHQTDHYCARWITYARRLTTKMFGRDFSYENPDELVTAVNLYVGDLFKSTIESWRIQKYRRTGIIWWSLMDMWTMGFNYSVADCNFKPKLPFHFIRLAQQPLLLAGKDPVNPGDAPELHVMNDTGEDQQGSYTIKSSSGEVIATGSFNIPKNGKLLLGQINVQPSDYCFIEWNATSESGRSFYVNPGEPYDFEKYQKLADCIRKL